MTDTSEAITEARVREIEWKLVPVEPTVGMFRGLTASWPQDNVSKALTAKWAAGSFNEDYAAMLAAAPPPPVQQEVIWQIRDGLSCSCGGGWLMGHASGCPEAESPPPSREEGLREAVLEEVEQALQDAWVSDMSLTEAFSAIRALSHADGGE